MNENTKIECLRLAVEFEKVRPGTGVIPVAEQFYEWVTSEDKPSSLQIKYEKTLKERE